MSIEASTASSQLHSLQILRAVAALAIALGHLNNYADATNLTKGISWIGVDMFFVLSGFIVAYTIQPYRLQPGAALTFLKKRAIRIFPIYWLMALLALLVMLLTGHPGERSAEQLFASFVLFPQKISEQLIPVAWTLNYEWLFYLISAALLFLAPRHFLIGCGVWLIALLAAQPFFVFEPAAHFSWVMYAGSLYQFEFLCGIAAAYAFMHPESLGRLRHLLQHQGVLWALFSLSCLWVLAGLLWGYLFVDHPQKFGHYTVFTLRCAVLGSGFAAMIYALCQLERLGHLRHFSNFWLRLGAASYVLYLLHDMVFILLGKGWEMLLGSAPIATPLLSWLVFMPIALAVTLWLSDRISRHIEKPMDRWLKKRLS